MTKSKSGLSVPELIHGVPYATPFQFIPNIRLQDKPIIHITKRKIIHPVVDPSVALETGFNAFDRKESRKAV